jgi:hypothetical protein
MDEIQKFIFFYLINDREFLSLVVIVVFFVYK